MQIQNAFATKMPFPLARVAKLKTKISKVFQNYLAFPRILEDFLEFSKVSRISQNSLGFSKLFRISQNFLEFQFGYSTFSTKNPNGICKQPKCEGPGAKLNADGVCECEIEHTYLDDGVCKCKTIINNKQTYLIFNNAKTKCVCDKKCMWIKKLNFISLDQYIAMFTPCHAIYIYCTLS